MRPRALLLLAFVLPLAGCAARNAMIRGVVPADAASQTVVWLEPADDDARRRRPGLVRVTQHDDGFRPRVLSVPVGGTVEFRNVGGLWHNVFSVSPARRFDLGHYGPGHRRRITFDQPGAVRLFCELHPNDDAWIVVTPPGAVAARPDHRGRYVLPPLPSGTYVMHAWDPENGERSRTIRLDARRGIHREPRF